jgi:hypothetical protein
MTKFVGNTITLPTLATAPSSPAAGDTYYNTTDNTAYVYNGTSWVDLAASGGGSGDITDVVAGAGLTGGASTGSATLDVGAGTGIIVNADDVAIDTSVVARKSDKLSVFAATTSAELAGVISNETGSGALVFGTGPTISLPIIDNPKIGYTTQATAASTLTLTSASNYYQYFTGTTASQVVVLPVTSTLALGQQYEINNNSTQSIAVQSSGLNAIVTVYRGMTYRFTCILTSGTTAASWEYEIVGVNTVTGVTGSPSNLVFSYAPNIDQAYLTSPQIYGGLQMGQTTVVTAGGTTNPGGSGSVFYRFTGTSTQTMTMPASSANMGYAWIIQNFSTGDVTVNASAGGTIVVLKTNQQVLLHATSTTPTTPSLWDIIYLGAPTYTGTGSSVFATSPTLVTPNLGTPSAINLSNATSLADAALAATGTAGTYTKVTTDAKGRVSSGTTLSESDIPTLSTVGKVSNSATTAASANTASAIVARDASGNFTAGTITATTVTGLSAPSSSTDAVNKAYVDSFSVGLNWHAAVKVVQTGNTSGVYTAGTSGFDGGTGVGAYIEAAVNGPISSSAVDGYSSWVLGDRLLYVGNTNATTNGIYKLTNLGSASSKWRFTRATDFDGSSPTAIVMAGDAVYVINGTTYGKSAWAVNSIGTGTDNNIIVGTDTIDFAQFNGAATLTAGAGLLTTGNTIDVVAGTGITTSGDQVSIDSTVATLAGTQAITNKTSYNKVAITAPATSATLALADGSTLATSGAFSTTLTATATTNATLPSGTTTLASNVTTTIGDVIYASATSVPGTLARLAGNTAAQPSFLSSTGNGTANTSTAFTSSTGSGNVVLANSPTLTTPSLGAATATSINGTTIPSSATLVTSVTGTANQVVASTSTGAVTLSLPQSIGTTNSPLFKTIKITPDTDASITSSDGEFVYRNDEYSRLTFNVAGTEKQVYPVPGATSSTAGAVILSASTSDTSSTTAATPSAVKSAYDLAAAAVPQTRTITGSFPVYANGVAGTAIPLSGNITISVADASATTSGVTNVITTFDTTSPYPPSGYAINNYYSSVLGSYAVTSYFQSVFYGSSSVLATHPREVLTTTNANTSGTLILTQFRPMKSFSVTNISVTSGATASASLTYCAFGIYTRSGTTFTRVRITASDTTIFNTANTKYTRALTSTYSVTAGVEYFIGVLQVGTTMATTLGATARADTAANAATGVQVYTVASQTTLGTALTGTAHATRADFAEVS